MQSGYSMYPITWYQQMPGIRWDGSKTSPGRGKELWSNLPSSQVMTSSLLHDIRSCSMQVCHPERYPVVAKRKQDLRNQPFSFWLVANSPALKGLFWDSNRLGQPALAGGSPGCSTSPIRAYIYYIASSPRLLFLLNNQDQFFHLTKAFFYLLTVMMLCGIRIYWSAPNNEPEHRPVGGNVYVLWSVVSHKCKTWWTNSASIFKCCATQLKQVPSQEMLPLQCNGLEFNK